MRGRRAAQMIVLHPGAARREERTGTVADRRLVIGIFDEEASADAAAETLKSSGAVVDDAMAVLVLDEDGKLRTHKVGATSGGKGAAFGLAFGLLGPVGLGIGAAGGALLGKLHHKDLGLEDADRERLVTALRGGKAALGVLATPDELVAVESVILDAGGTTESHEFDDARLREAVDSAGT
jgi:uncharacterized membrane protein